MTLVYNGEATVANNEYRDGYVAYDNDGDDECDGGGNACYGVDSSICIDVLTLY